VRENDRGLPLQRLVVTALKSLAGLRCRQQLLDLLDERRRVGVGRGRIGFRRLIDADDELRQ
jgi:hypothetical protein